MNVSAVTSYLSHPRLMPLMNLMGGWPQDNSTGVSRPFRPYKLASIKRSAEIALVFDGSLAPHPVESGVWTPHGEVPVALRLDQYGIMNGPPIGTFMTDNYPASGPAWLSPNASLNFDNPDFNTDGSSLNSHQIRFRHMRDRRVNVLMADGHVANFDFRDGTNTGMRRLNINVNPND
jgi:prepilin-type processing-associated H-X9-DG protein